MLFPSIKNNNCCETLEKSHENVGSTWQSATYNVQKVKIFVKDFFSKCDQIRRKLRIFSHSLERSLMENFTFCAVLNKSQRFL